MKRIMIINWKWKHNDKSYFCENRKDDYIAAMNSETHKKFIKWGKRFLRSIKGQDVELIIFLHLGKPNKVTGNSIKEFKIEHPHRIIEFNLGRGPIYSNDNGHAGIIKGWNFCPKVLVGRRNIKQRTFDKIWNYYWNYGLAKELANLWLPVWLDLQSLIYIQDQPLENTIKDEWMKTQFKDIKKRGLKLEKKIQRTKEILSIINQMEDIAFADEILPILELLKTLSHGDYKAFCCASWKRIGVQFLSVYEKMLSTVRAVC